MSYTINEGDTYEISSKVINGKCMMCQEFTLIQQLPTKYNAGELYTVDLCNDCLQDLAIEILDAELRGEIKQHEF